MFVKLWIQKSEMVAENDSAWHWSSGNKKKASKLKRHIGPQICCVPCARNERTHTSEKLYLSNGSQRHIIPLWHMWQGLCLQKGTTNTQWQCPWKLEKGLKSKMKLHLHFYCVVQCLLISANEGNSFLRSTYSSWLKIVSNHLEVKRSIKFDMVYFFKRDLNLNLCLNIQITSIQFQT